jgi:hypothetical protein
VIPVLNAHAIRSVVGRFGRGCCTTKFCPSLASGEPGVRLLPEGILGRGVNSFGTTVLARGWARTKRDRVPW